MGRVTYNIGPKLGDFIHGLVIPKYVYDTTGEKATIYISNSGCTFTSGLEKTYKELKPILEMQPFVSKFRVYEKQTIDYEVFRFRSSPLLFKKGWTEIYFRIILGVDPPTDFAWLQYPTESNNLTLINRSVRPMSKDTHENYENLISTRECEFIYSDPAQYENFPLKIKGRQVTSLKDMVREISACSLFIGNQSAPLAIASALGKERIAELRRGLDAPHYDEDKEFHSKLHTFVGD